MGLAVEHYIRSLDVREAPRYHFGQAARYLGMNETRLRNWFVGYYFPTGSGERRWAGPILKPADEENNLLSFYDIASAHVILGFRRKSIPLRAVRDAITYYVTQIDSQRYPLLSEDFYTFGKDIIIEQLGQHISLTKQGTDVPDAQGRNKGSSDEAKQVCSEPSPDDIRVGGSGPAGQTGGETTEEKADGKRAGKE